MKSTSFPVLIIGLGSQAKAWALNMQDCGVPFSVALRKNSPNHELATKLNIKIEDLETVDFSKYEIILNLIPDDSHKEFLESYANKFSENTSIFYAHGFSLTKYKFQKDYNHLNHILLAPKAIASELRFKFETKSAIAAATSLEACYDNHLANLHLQYILENIGITELIECTIEQETLADLFSEQSLLCSVLPYSALLSYNKLREKGIPEKLAYVECWMEMKMIVDALMKLGPEEFFKLISPNALFGGEKGRKDLLGKDYQNHLDNLIEDVWSGKFFVEAENINYRDLQNELVGFWKGQELTEIHNSWGRELI